MSEKISGEKTEKSPAQSYEQTKELRWRDELANEFHLSEEYRAGLKPLEYRYEFAGGKVLEASQDQAGIAHIVFRDKNGIAFDFASLLPEGMKLVTPIYFKNFPEEKKQGDFTEFGWMVDDKRGLVLMGEFKTPKHLLALLHEIGHLRNNSSEDMNLRDILRDQSFRGYYGISQAEKDFARVVSKTERDAWSWALQTIRKIQNEIGFDYSDFFPKFHDFKRFIAYFLGNYRNDFAWLATDADFSKEMKKLFDRRQSSSKSPE
jgi:hypothetical protein